MRIALGADQVGYPLKQALVNYLNARNYEVIDFGTDSPDRVVDYPDYARMVALSVSSGKCERGVLVCGTGVGMTIAANKFPGARAAWSDDIYVARQSRIHNDANILCMGALVTPVKKAEAILDEWLATSFEFGRHVPRLAKLDTEFLVARSSRNEQKFTDAMTNIQLGVALSPRKSVFGPLMFAGELQEGLQAAAQSGFSAVELSLRCPDDVEKQELAEMLKLKGLSLSAIATGQSCLHDQLCLCTPDEGLREKTVERLKRHIDLAAGFEAKVIIGGIRGKMTGSAGEQAKQRAGAVEAIRACAVYALDKGVTLLIEPINRYETNFINTVQDGMDLIDEIGESSLKLLPDTFHMNIEENDIDLALRRAQVYTGYVHFADSNRMVPGKGHINFARIMETLADIGYAGIVTVEALPLPNDQEAIQMASGFLRSLL